jgi:hypothetical protein
VALSGRVVQSSIVMVPGAGFEPATFGLQNRCSTPELTRRSPITLGFLSAKFDAGMNIYHLSTQSAAVCAPNVLGLGRPTNVRTARSGLAERGEHRFNLCNGVLLHPGHDVRIQVKGDAYLGVPEPFAGDLHMHPRCQHVSGMCVAQIVEADAGQGGALNRTGVVASVKEKGPTREGEAKGTMMSARYHGRD